MNGHTKCNVCGADYSLHHALTDKCPEDGIEAAPGKKQRWAETFFTPVTAKDKEIMDAKCKNCGHAYSSHAHYMLKCPDGSEFLDDQFFAAKDATYAESIAKIADSMSFLVRELQDAHGAAPNVGTQIVLMDYLEKIVKIKTDVNRLKAETKGR